MSRFTALWKASPRKVLLAFAGLILAAALAVGSGANFNSTSANPSNVFTAGIISHTNSKSGAAILTAANIVPGGTAAGFVDIKNTGTAAGQFTLTKGTAADTPVSPGLSKKLLLTIKNTGDPTCVTGCPAPVVLYTGTMNAMPATIALGSSAVNENDRYTFSVNFPDAGTGGADNAYQGASTVVEYDWSSTS